MTWLRRAAWYLATAGVVFTGTVVAILACEAAVVAFGMGQHRLVAVCVSVGTVIGVAETMIIGSDRFWRLRMRVWGL